MKSKDTSTDLLLQWCYGYPTLDSITQIRNELNEPGLHPELVERLHQLMVWLAAGTFLPISAAVFTYAESRNDSAHIPQED